MITLNVNTSKQDFSSNQTTNEHVLNKPLSAIAKLLNIAQTRLYVILENQTTRCCAKLLDQLMLYCSYSPTGECTLKLQTLLDKTEIRSERWLREQLHRLERRGWVTIFRDATKPLRIKVNMVQIFGDCLGKAWVSKKFPAPAVTAGVSPPLTLYDQTDLFTKEKTQVLNEISGNNIGSEPPISEEPVTKNKNETTKQAEGGPKTLQESLIEHQKNIERIKRDEVYDNFTPCHGESCPEKPPIRFREWSDSDVSRLITEKARRIFQKKFYDRDVTLRDLMEECFEHYKARGIRMDRFIFELWVKNEIPDKMISDGSNGYREKWPKIYTNRESQSSSGGSGFMAGAVGYMSRLFSGPKIKAIPECPAPSVATPKPIIKPVISSEIAKMKALLGLL